MERKRKFYQKWWFWLIVIIFVVVIGSQASSNNGSNSSSNGTSKTFTKSITTVSFEQMVKDYLSNGSNADDTYKSKELEFEGTVSKITDGVISGVDVEIDAGNFTDNQFMNTSAIVNVSKDVAKQLQSGQSYTFIAKGNGALVLDGNWVSTLNFNDGKIK